MKNPTLCAVDGCDNPVRVKLHGLCWMHYQRWWRHGVVGQAALLHRSPTADLLESFWDSVDRNGPLPEHRPELGPCWPWLGSTSRQGYGYIVIARRKFAAHRMAFTQERGEIPEGLDLDHLCHGPPCEGGDSCRHRRCVNPDHLEPVTCRENLLRSHLTVTARNAAKTHCPQGHPYDELNTMIQTDGSRKCRNCDNARRRKQRAANGRVT